MSFIDDLKKSEFLKSDETRAAIFVTGILIIIAAFLVYNYYQKTDNLDDTNNQALNDLTEEKSETSDEATLAEEVEKGSYIVKENDTLWSIADKELNDPYRWTEIKELNGLQSSEVKKGDVLKLPAREENEVLAQATEEAEETVAEETTEETETEETVAETKEEETVKTGEILADTSIRATTYTVERGDTLWSIAEKMYGDPYQYTKILDANPQLGRLPDGNVLIHAGNVLNLPGIDGFTGN